MERSLERLFVDPNLDSSASAGSYRPTSLFHGRGQLSLFLFVYSKTGFLFVNRSSTGTLSQVYKGHLQETVGSSIDCANYFNDLPMAFKHRKGIIFEGADGEEPKLEVVNMLDVLKQVEEGSDVGQMWIYPGMALA